MRVLIALVYVVLLVFGVAFAALNSSSVVVDFYFFSMKLPISLVVTLFFGIGVFLGVLFTLGKYWRMKLKVYKLTNQLSALKNSAGAP